MTTHSLTGNLTSGSTSLKGESSDIRPGWPEVVASLLTYLALLLLIGFWLLSIPDDQAALRGIVGMATNGVAGSLALLSAYLLRLRSLPPFGFRGCPGKEMAAAAGLGVLAFGLSFGVEYVYFLFVTEPNNQADFQAAAQSGPLALAVLLFTGAVLTPLGEEVVFRGVVANALNRHGWWAGVVGSALIFAAVHGPSVIFLMLFW